MERETVKQWKIGTWTTGIGLICIGVFVILNTSGWASWHILSYLWPLLIIGFGLELILSRVLYPEVRLRVSGLATVFIIIVCLASFGQFAVERVGSSLNWKIAFGPSYLSKIQGQVPIDSNIHKIDVEITSGDVTLKGVDGSTVSYDGELPIPAGSQDEADKRMKDDWEVKKEGDTLILQLNAQKSISLFDITRAKGTLIVEVPKALLSKVGEANGSVHVNGMNAGSDVRTINGEVMFQSIQGDVSASTTNGACHATKVQGMVNMHTTNGDISANNVAGKLTGHTTNGSVDVSSAIGGNWDIHTTNGSISLDVNKDASAQFSADTTTGKVQGDLSWKYDDDHEHHGTAQLGSSQYGVALHTTNGGITVKTDK